MPEQPPARLAHADPEFLRLVLCYLEGELGADGVETLQAQLRSDAAKRGAFVRLCLTGSALIAGTGSGPAGEKTKLDDLPEWPRLVDFNESMVLSALNPQPELRALNVLRQQGERHLSLDDDLMEALEVEWEGYDQDDSGMMAAAMRRCVDRLAQPNARGLIHRRYTEKARYPDLAKELNRPVVSLYTTFSRIYAVLADCIAKQLVPEGGEHA